MSPVVKLFCFLLELDMCRLQFRFNSLKKCGKKQNFLKINTKVTILRSNTPKKFQSVKDA